LLFSAVVSYRYLHPMPAFVLIALAVIATPRMAMRGSVVAPAPIANA
jgi:hypothetical protein